MIAAFAGALVGDGGESTDENAAFGGALIGFLCGLLVGHVAWAVLAAKILGRFGRTARTAVACIAPPALVVASFRSIPELGWAVLAFPIVAPAMLSWWATAPHDRY